MNRISVSAPGKLMLLGEHAVVYNHPCLVTAVDKRIYVTVEIIDKNEFQLEARDVGIVGYRKSMIEVGKGDIPKGARFVEVAIKNTLRHSGLSRISSTVNGAKRFWSRPLSGLPRMTRGVRVVTKSEFSPKLGLGSSSASVVCTVKAISELLGLNFTNKEIFDLSYKTVLDVQGKGSGFDIAAAIYGGTIYFVTGGKVIESFNIKELPLVVGYSGMKANTVSIINKVKKDFANRQDRLKEIYNSIEILVREGKEAVIKTDWKRLGLLMNQNQDYLRELQVSSDKLEKMISAALNAGAHGAKFSGAGGGDCMITIVSNEKKERVREAIRRVGGEVIDVKTGVEGVRTE